MKVYLGADHRGMEFKKAIADFLERSHIEIVDTGSTTLDPNDDFPQFAGKVATALLADTATDSRGILICGSGQGMAMAANRFKGIRASLCWSLDEARSARNDDDSNVLCLSATFLSLPDAQAIVSTWLNTPFAGAERFKRRIQELDQLG